VSQALFQHLLFVVFPLCAAYGAISDMMTMTIPNWLVGVMVGFFLLLAPLSGMDLSVFALHWAAAIVLLVVAFACFAMGWIGGGDAKFAAAIVLWLGPQAMIEFLVFAALFGGALTLAVLSFRARLLPAFALRQHWLMRLHDPKAGVPYGVALAAAALVVYPDTLWLGLAAS
jgi:prepilin peptidase CpaA